MSTGHITISRPKSETRDWYIITTGEDAVAAQTAIREAYHEDRETIIFLIQESHAYKITSDLMMSFNGFEIDQAKVDQRIKEMKKELEEASSITLESVPRGFALAAETGEEDRPF